MYRIIGSDGQPYGPVDAAQLREWFAQNRVRGDTLIEKEGDPGWRPLSSFPEFAELFAPGSTAGSSGATTNPSAEQLVAAAEARRELDAMSCLTRGWDLVMARFWLSIGVAAVCLVVMGVPLLYGPAMAGLFWFFLRRIRTGNGTIEDAFEPFKVVLLHSFLAGLVVSVLVSIGAMLCLLPGLFLAALWTFVWPLLMDYRLEFWPAMEVSRRVALRNLGGIVVLWCLSALLLLAGWLLCGIGVFFTTPIVIAAHAYAYEDLFGIKPGPEQSPSLPSTVH